MTECVHCKSRLKNTEKELATHGKMCLGIERLEGVLLYGCFTCEYVTKQKTHFLGHIRKHTGNKPYKCSYPYCDYESARGYNLAGHMMRKHKDILTNDDEGNVIFNLTGKTFPKKGRPRKILDKYQPGSKLSEESGLFY